MEANLRRKRAFRPTCFKEENSIFFGTEFFTKSINDPAIKQSLTWKLKNRHINDMSIKVIDPNDGEEKGEYDVYIKVNIVKIK